MADNSPTSGGSGDVVATDDLTNVNGVAFTGAKVQRTKVGYGADGYLQDVTEAKGLPVTVNPTQNPAGLPVFDDAVNALLASTSTSNDARSLLDVLDPLSDNYVAPQAEIIGSMGRVITQDPLTGGLVALAASDRYGGSLSTISTANAVTFDTSRFASFSLIGTCAGGVNVIVEGLVAGVWTSIYGALQISTTLTITNIINASVTGYFYSNTHGCTSIRLRCFVASAGTSFPYSIQFSQNVLQTPTVSVVASQSAAASLLVQAFGASAEDAAASGNPVLVGGVARTAILPTTVVAGDVVRHTLNISGSLITEPHCVDELRWSYAAAAAGIANSTTPVTIKAAPAAGTHLCLCSGFIMSEALTAATEFVIREITTTTVVFRTKLWTSGMAGTQITFDPPIKITSANGLEIVTLTASVAGAVYFNANGYTANG